ncbi:MAG TPA: M1 family metallopeptidase [Longimicrobiaceae bacterium]
MIHGFFRGTVAVALLMTAAPLISAQEATPTFTRADTLRGTITPERSWWDVVFYDLHVRVNPADSSISGWNGITYRVVEAPREMQIDLFANLEVDSILQDGRPLQYRREGNAIFVTGVANAPIGAIDTVTVHYHGKPTVAANAPWDGGFDWSQDRNGNPFVATAVQGMGASAWWPNKDHQSEEPDSQRIAITVPAPLVDVSNGRLRSRRENDDGTVTYEWFVSNPINNYNVAANIGDYAHFSDVYQGEAGELTLDFWPLSYNLEAARRQWQQTKPMLACFEHWFGPYPWYEDGFKLVETPHLGMEHQSAVAYGNGYGNGYRGRDLSGTGYGLKWDFILVHEAGHEWFGNNVTTEDIADMWVHEGFTNYSEGLYTECRSGKEAGAQYIIGSRRNIQNDRPIVGVYGVNNEGSGDMYYKTGSMLHMIRQIIDDDELWRSILRGINQDFRHQTVTGTEIQAYINRRSGKDFSRVFQQYLTTTEIPQLEYHFEGNELRFRWQNVVEGFDMPVRVWLGNELRWLQPTQEWQTVTVSPADPESFRVDDDFYVEAVALEGAGSSG